MMVIIQLISTAKVLGLHPGCGPRRTGSHICQIVRRRAADESIQGLGQGRLLFERLGVESTDSVTHRQMPKELIVRERADSAPGRIEQVILVRGRALGMRAIDVPGHIDAQGHVTHIGS